MKAPIIALAIGLAHGAATSTAIAETLEPLPSGKPAGVHRAQQVQSQTMWFAAVALLGIGVGLATSNNGSPSAQTAMSTTSTVNSP